MSASPCGLWVRELAQDWYGVSERTAERGYLELGRENLWLTRQQSMKSIKSPTGLKTVTWRALAGPYSTAARAALQAQTGVAAAAAGRPPTDGRT